MEEARLRLEPGEDSFHRLRPSLSALLQPALHTVEERVLMVLRGRSAVLCSWFMSSSSASSSHDSAPLDRGAWYSCLTANSWNKELPKETIGHIQSAGCLGQKEVVTAAHNACIWELLQEVDMHGKVDRHMKLLTIETESRLGTLWDQEQCTKLCSKDELWEASERGGNEDSVEGSE